MVMNDILASALTKIKQYEKLGRSVCIISPVSGLVAGILGILKKFGYIEGYEKVKEGNKLSFHVKLNGNINKCGVIKPRYSIKKDDFERFEKRYLPSKDMGIMVVTTVNGIMEHNAAKKKQLGGRLIAYCY
ncbi:30S ribosomal protein S8 [Candidatus Woesearchaeota archaeon]|nr:30S ribosomal protein S8 [Candidatus Woesearchaeota archaeon]